MNKAFEKIIEKLEEIQKEYLDGFGVHNNNEIYGIACGLGDAIEIVKQEAEQYNNGWIPCSGCADCEHKECENYGKV